MIKHTSQISDRPTALLAATVGAVVLCAGLLWLSQSSALATTGQRIYELDRDRRALLERRSEAMLAYAAATDPRRLEERAQALGFGPVAKAKLMVVAPGPGAPTVANLWAESPLAITVGHAVPVTPPQMTLTERLLAASLSSASADAREVPAGVGSAP